MAKVQQLKTVEPSADEYVVVELERLLEEARKGSITAVVYAAKRSAVDDRGAYVSTGTAGSDDVFEVLGMASRLVHTIQRDLDDVSWQSQD